MTDTGAMTLDSASTTPARERLVGVVAAETAGTALLVTAIVGSGIAADRAFPDSPGLALLVNAIATGGALAALIVALGHVSAAFNPLDLAGRRTSTP